MLQDGQDFYLIVQNSGPPVPPARVREVMELLQDHERRKDFKGTCNGRGICNIHDRLQLYYGDAYGFTFFSGAEGTRCLRTFRPVSATLPPPFRSLPCWRSASASSVLRNRQTRRAFTAHWCAVSAGEIPEIQEKEQRKDNTDKIDRAPDYIRRHYSEDLSLDSVAEYVSLHPSYLSYLFKKKTGDCLPPFPAHGSAAGSMPPDAGKAGSASGADLGTGGLPHKHLFLQRPSGSTSGKSPRDWQKGKS